METDWASYQKFGMSFYLKTRLSTFLLSVPGAPVRQAMVRRPALFDSRRYGKLDHCGYPAVIKTRRRKPCVGIVLLYRCTSAAGREAEQNIRGDGELAGFHSYFARIARRHRPGRGSAEEDVSPRQAAGPGIQ